MDPRIVLVSEYQPYSLHGKSKAFDGFNDHIFYVDVDSCK
jgi:hypothetical protein